MATVYGRVYQNLEKWEKINHTIIVNGAPARNQKFASCAHPRCSKNNCNQYKLKFGGTFHGDGRTIFVSERWF